MNSAWKITDGKWRVGQAVGYLGMGDSRGIQATVEPATIYRINKEAGRIYVNLKHGPLVTSERCLTELA